MTEPDAIYILRQIGEVGIVDDGALAVQDNAVPGEVGHLEHGFEVVDEVLGCNGVSLINLSDDEIAEAAIRIRGGGVDEIDDGEEG